MSKNLTAARNLITSLLLALALVACDSKPDHEPVSEPPADEATTEDERESRQPTDRPPAEPGPDTSGLDQRSPLERASSVEATLQQSADRRRQEIDDAGGA